MEVFLNKKPLYFLIILSIFILINSENLTPLGECTKGRAGLYTGWRNGGKCGFGKHQDTINAAYMFPAALNQDFFNSAAQCGVCYEMVGPNGVIRVRVEDYCPKSQSYCSGDEHHFNVADEGTSYIMGSSQTANITFRMVACDIEENIKILTPENLDISNNFFSFVVLNHKLAISHVEMEQNNSNTWSNLTRQENNYWLYYNQSPIKFPLQFKIYSINGDFVTVILGKLEANQTYYADGNFKVPENTYFDPDTLKKTNIDDNSKTKCCSNTETSSTSSNYIYNDGTVNSQYFYSSQNASVITNEKDSYRGTYSLNAKFYSNGKIFFLAQTPVNVGQSGSITITMKAKQTCNNCLYISAYGLNNNLNVGFNDANAWKDYTYSFSLLGLTNQFTGIVFEYNQYTTQSFEIYIDKIELIFNSNVQDSGLCFSTAESNSNSSQSSEEPKNDTNLNPNYVYINRIVIYEDSPKILNFNTSGFSNLNSKKLIVRLTQKNDSTSFYDINSCTSSNPYVINSFTCTLPDDIPDGIYRINPQDNEFNFTYGKDIEAKNGLLIFGDINSLKQKYINEYYSPLILIYSKEKTITAGERVNFHVYPIPQEEYNLDNEEIILINKEGDKSLHLKYCHQKIINKTVISVQCTVSNNIIKGNYTSLYSNQIASLSDGQTLNLIVNDNKGGIIRSGNTQVINVNSLTSAQKNDFSLSFNVLYYNQNIKSGDEFPHPVYLYGMKSSTYRRQLDEASYDYRIVFDKCITQSYSGDSSAIGSINCRAPDFIHAGTYSKLESDGLDSNIEAPINIYFDRDFNRSSKSSRTEDPGDDNYNSSRIRPDDDDDDESSSSSSKKWVAWLIVAIIVVVFIAIIITIIAFKKGDDDENTSSDKVNDSSNVKNNTSSG